MALAELLTGGGILAGSILNRFRPKEKFKKIDTSRIRSTASARTASQNALQQANIKQAGAAGRLPQGAIASSLARAKASTVDPALDSQILNAEKFNANQDTRASLTESSNFDDLVNFNLSGAGTLAKLSMLRKYGFLGGSDAQQ